MNSKLISLPIAIGIANMPISKCFSLILLAHLLIGTSANCQSLSPQVFASAGGYQNSAVGSLSFTIGETVTPTFTSANNMLTQGFQQPYKMTLNVKAYLQGYYAGAGSMENVLYNQGVNAAPGDLTDTVTIQLRQGIAPYALITESKQVIHTDGTVTFGGTASVGQNVYVVLKHRNTVETWSATPVALTENTYYDFSTNSNKAYGSNQIQVQNGVWALYSGDINQDENIDLLDLGIVETDINNFGFGYLASDLNGDGNVDLLDSPLVEINISDFVFSVHP